MSALTPDELAALYGRHCADIVRYLRNRGADTELAEDLAQDVFLRAARAPRYEDQGRPLAWLHTIAGTVLLDHWKSSHARRSVPVWVTDWSDATAFHWGQVPEDPHQAVARRAWLAEVRAALAAAAAELRPRYWRVLQLRMLDELSVAEAAQAMGVSVPALKTAQTRALRALLQDPRVRALRTGLSS